MNTSFSVERRLAKSCKKNNKQAEHTTKEKTFETCKRKRIYLDICKETNKLVTNEV